MFPFSHFAGTLPGQTLPVIAGLTDGVAATGTSLTVLLDGSPPAGAIQWLRNGSAIAGETGSALAVPDAPGDTIAVAVDGLEAASVLIVRTRVVDFGFGGAVLNPGDVITVTADGATALAGEAELTRDNQPLPLSGGQYTVTTADVGRSFAARQTDLPSNRSASIPVEATPVPVLLTAPGVSGGTLEGGIRSVDMTDSWQADAAPAAIALREYRLVTGDVAGPAQASPDLTIPQGSAGQTAQAQIRARTATSAFSAWEDAGATVTVGAASSWQISDGGDGTFSITGTAGPASAPVVTNNGDGTFDIAA